MVIEFPLFSKCLFSVILRMGSDVTCQLVANSLKYNLKSLQLKGYLHFKVKVITISTRAVPETFILDMVGSLICTD